MKSGNYDSVTRKVTWTITVRNPGKQNLSNYVVTDAIQNSKAKIDASTVKLYGGEKEDACKTEISGGTLAMTTGDQGFTYTFPTINAGEEMPYYKIVYQSDAPDNEESILNTVTIEDQNGRDKDSTTVNGNIKESGGLLKSTGNSTLQDAGNGLQKATWYITPLIPRAKRFKPVTISDTFQPVKCDNGQTVEHYALLGELFDQLNGGIEVFPDSDTNRYYLTDWNNQGITVTYKFQTASGEENIASTDVPTAEQRKLKVTGFSVTVSSKNGIRQINIGNTGKGNGYTTYVDVSNVPEDVSCTIQNKAHLDSFGDKSATYTYKKDKAPEEKEEIVKQVADDAGQNYTKDPSKDYATAQQEGIFYKISLKPAKGRKEITVVDTLPDGLVYDPNHAAQAVFSKKSPSSGKVKYDGTIDDTLGSKIYWQADGTLIDSWTNPTDYAGSFDLSSPENFTVAQSADGKTLIFTIKNLDQIPDKVKKSYQTIGIFYALQLTQDTDWGNKLESSKVYQNTANWTGVGEASAKITVKCNDTYLDKKVEQSSNGRLTYTVDINPNGLTLNPKSNEITLYDTFTVNKRGTATLDRSSIKLHDCTENEDTEDYMLTTDEKKEDRQVTHYNMTLTVRDGKHYKFTYTYIVDRSQVDSNDEVTAKNKARITAVWQEADDKKITSSAGGGSVGSNDGELTLYKVDKNSENKVLQGAKFELTAYDRQSGSWDTAQTVTAYTDEKGEITFVPATGTNPSKVYVSVDTLYKLVETKAPNGYVLDAKPLYFIWMQSDASEKANQKEAYKTATGKKKETDKVDPDGTSYQDVTYFQTRHSYERKFTNAPMQLEFEKVWADEDGKVMSPPAGVTEIQLNVYKYTEAVFNKNTAEFVKTVTLNTGNLWREKLHLKDSDENTRYYVEEVGVPDGYKVTYTNSAHEQTQLGYADGDKVTVTNQKRHTKLTVYKNWCDQNGTPTSNSTVTEISVTLHGKPKDGMAGEKTKQTVTLKAEDGWKHVFEDLNPDYLYTVEESPIPGFNVSYSYSEGSSETTGVAPGGTVTITNTDAPTYELPSTGAPGGTVPYTAGGAAIALAAVLCGYNSRRKRKRGEE